MTCARFSGLDLLRYEGRLSDENGDNVLFGQLHSPGTATQVGPVAFGDLKIDRVDIGAGGTADLLVVDGQLSFAGALRLRAVNGLAAKLSDRYKLFSFTSFNSFNSFTISTGCRSTFKLSLLVCASKTLMPWPAWSKTNCSNAQLSSRS